jgi:uncharacterized protein
MSSEKWGASRFNAYRTVRGNLVIHNSFTGAILSVPPGEEQSVVRTALRYGVDGPVEGVLAEIAGAGMLVPGTADEFRRARVTHEIESRSTNVLHLVVMPTEQCNFRCTYCYEQFLRGEMEPGIREGLKRYVEQKARRIEKMSVSWFGGEPLAAPGVMRELSESFLESCRKYDVDYVANVTTNGYFMTPELIPELLAWQVKSFQITLDGPPRTHDSQRRLMGGGPTFDQIFRNLQALMATDAEFILYLRINYNQQVLRELPELLGLLAKEFGGDSRLCVVPRPVGYWGGPNDGCFDTGDSGDMFDVMEMALRYGLRSAHFLKTAMQPHGSVCYAANPHSLVVGADGTLYKCTVALDDDRNHVGRLHPDGRVELDMDRFGLWVTQDEIGDPGCQKCFFRPACQGNACPWERIKKGEAPCPEVKRQVGHALQVIALEEELLGSL